VAKDTGRAAGGAATDSRNAVGAAVSKAKGPALVTGAVAATLGGALLVGSKALPKRKHLKIRLPRRRSRLSQATRAARAAHIQILDAADRVGAVGNQLCDINERLQAITSSARDREAPSRPR